MRDDPCKGDGQVVSEAKICKVGLLYLVLLQGAPESISPVKDSVEQLVPFLSVLSKQG